MSCYDTAESDMWLGCAAMAVSQLLAVMVLAEVCTSLHIGRNRREWCAKQLETSCFPCYLDSTLLMLGSPALILKDIDK